MGRPKKIKEPVPETGKSIQSSIVKRFMTDEEWYEFRKEYFANRIKLNGKDRAQTLSLAVSEEDMAILSDYLLDTDLKLAEIGENHNLSKSSVTNRARATAMRLLYQHQEVLSRLIK